MNFNSATEILTAISAMQWASQPVQGNRAKINRLFNGDPPLTEEERRLNRLNTNFNFLEPTRIAANARYQIENAMTQPGDYFNIRLDYGPAHKRDQWSVSLTNYVNRILRRDRQHRFTNARNQAIAQTVLHGPGPSLWKNRKSPAPTTCGVDDVLVPAGTLADMSNLDYLAVYREWTWGQLKDMVSGPAVDKGWNSAYVDALLKALYKQPLQALYQGNRWLFPEKIAEDVKENTSSWAAAALCRVLAWDFYFRNEKTGKWNRRILLDYNNFAPEGLRNQFSPDKQAPQFLYTKENFADDWTEVIHWYVGNCSNVAPFRYYSIRSIGYLMYGISLVQNMYHCRMTDHVLQSLLTWFRNVSEDDRERLQDIELQHLGIFPDGLSIVTAGERYSADWDLVGGALQQNRQLMAESSSSFLPDLAVEGDKPAMTATESLIRNNASVTLTSAVLNQLYNQSEPQFREISRRFCIKDNDDPMAVELRKCMKEDEIPLEALDVERWEITPNRVMGGGNRAVELTTARALFEIRGALGAEGAAKATRKYVLALTNDAQETKDMVPEEQKVSDSAMLANLAFGSLMEGVPVLQKKGINEIDYIETMLQLMALCMQPLEALQEQPAAMATNAERIAGLVNVGQNIEQHIAVLAMDPGERERVNDYGKAINGMMQQLKAYGERLGEMEQAQAEQSGQGGLSAEAQAKIQAMIITAQSKARIDAEKTQHKLQLSDAKFMSEQGRRDAETVAEIRRKDALTQADVAAKDLTTRAQLLHEARAAQHDRVQSAADAEQDRMHAQEKAKIELTAKKKAAKKPAAKK